MGGGGGERGEGRGERGVGEEGGWEEREENFPIDFLDISSIYIRIFLSWRRDPQTFYKLQVSGKQEFLYPV